MILLTIIFFLFILSIFVFFKKLSSLVNTYDIPNARKLHKEKISLAGGVYIFISTFFYLLLILIIDKSRSEIFFNITTQYLNFFVIFSSNAVLFCFHSAVLKYMRSSISALVKRGPRRSKVSAFEPKMKRRELSLAVLCC